MIYAKPEFSNNPAVIKVIGTGGAGCNAVNRMIRCGLTGVEFISMNTDVQALRASEAHVRIQLGKELLKGLGAGGDPEKGKQAAIESKDRIKEVLDGTDMLFITAGMGGGTGTGSAPVIAEIAKSFDVLTVGVCTIPFEWEGQIKKQQALNGLNELKKYVDTLITIPNEKAFVILDERSPIDAAFQMIDDVLRQAVQSVSEVITKSGEINRDFNDVKRILKNAGEALIGMGEASGEDRAIMSTRKAMENPLLENVSITGAKKILVNITSFKSKTSIGEIQNVMGLVKNSIAHDAEVFFGTVDDDAMEDRMKVTIIASGLPPKQSDKFKQKVKPTPKSTLDYERMKQNLEIPAYLSWKVKIL